MICVYIQKPGFEETVRILSSPVTEMAELRLDLSDYGTEEVTRLCSMPVPVIATCRCGISGEAKADRQLSAAIQAGAAFVDIELGMTARLAGKLIAEAEGAGCRIIRSYHDFDGTPELETLVSKVRECLEGHADIVKIVTTAIHDDDPAKVLSLYSAPECKGLEGRLVAFAMGEKGKNSRMDSLAAGAPFIYASTGGCPTAPGQPDVSEACHEIYGNDLPLRLMDGTIRIPRSKSTLQREIMASALAGECYKVDSEDICDDVEAALGAASIIIGKMKEDIDENNVEKQ